MQVKEGYIAHRLAGTIDTVTEATGDVNIKAEEGHNAHRLASHNGYSDRSNCRC